jgi:L-cystine uptake protein TcyP (sodium:dicarboxylate symporter family)
MVAANGFYIFQIFDDYAAGIALLVIALFQCIGVAWIYGNERYILVALRQYFSVIPSGYIDLQVKLIIIPYLSISKT